MGKMPPTLCVQRLNESQWLEIGSPLGSTFCINSRNVSSLLNTISHLITFMRFRSIVSVVIDESNCQNEEKAKR